MTYKTILTQLSQARTDIAAAITNRGGRLSSGDGFADYADAIDALPGGAPDYEVAVLSDVHIGAFGTASNSACRQKWTHALRWANAWAQLAVVCGDATYNGVSAEFTSYALLRDNVRAIPVHSVSGNHDTKGGATQRDSILSLLQATETKLGATVQDSCGWSFRQGEDLFVGLHEYSEAEGGLFVPGALDWLAALLEKNRDRRCFLFFHVFDDADDTAGNASGQYDTATDIWSETSDECRRFVALLRHYQNVLWFHGHTHSTFNEQMIDGVWQDKANIDARGTLRNVHVSSVGYPRAKAGTGYTWLDDESQGYRMAVYGNYITLQAVDLVTGATLYSYAIDTTPVPVAAGSFVDPTATTVAVTGVTLSQTALSLALGGSATLTATVSPENATDAAVTWTSSDETVATVSGGVVTLLQTGTATITAAAGGVSAACTVTDVYGTVTALESLAWYDGATVSSDDGAISAASGAAVSSLVALDGAAAVDVTVHTSTGGRVHYYDSAKAWLSCSDALNAAGQTALTPPSGAAYFRVQAAADDHYDVALDTAAVATAYTDQTDIDHYAWFDGYSPKTDTGVWRSKAGDAATNYISVGDATTLTVTVEATPGGCVHYYDASLTWLGHDDGNGLSTSGTKDMTVGTHALTLPEDAAWFVVTGYTAAGGHYSFALS